MVHTGMGHVIRELEGVEGVCCFSKCACLHFSSLCAAVTDPLDRMSICAF